MIRTLALDDEPLALQQLAAYIKKITYLELVGECQSAIDAHCPALSRLVRPCIGFHLSACSLKPRFVEAAHHPFCPLMSGCPCSDTTAIRRYSTPKAR